MKRKKHTYEDRLKYMKLLEEGRSINFVHTQYGIGRTLLITLWRQYKEQGPSALVIRRTCCKKTVAEKMAAIRDFKEKHLYLPDVSQAYGVSEGSLLRWVRLYEAGGRKALENKPKANPNDMGRPRKKKPEEMTELERLRYENKRLQAENELLKKVKALVEEKEARLRGAGQKPSGN